MFPLHPRLLVVVLCAVALCCPAIAQSAGQTNTELAADAPQGRELPDSPGTTWAKSQEPAPQQNSPEPTAQQNSSSQPSISEDQSPAPSAGRDKLQRPVGTAAAEAPKVSGITAAQPAGVAVAPAKQRRVRTIVLKVGAILGAGAAVGTVVALTAATPSKPPGAH